MKLALRWFLYFWLFVDGAAEAMRFLDRVGLDIRDSFALIMLCLIGAAIFAATVPGWFVWAFSVDK